MAVEASGSVSCFATSVPSPSQCRRSSQVNFRTESFQIKQYNGQQFTSIKVQPWKFRCGLFKSRRSLQRRNCFPDISDLALPDDMIDVDASESEELPLDFTPEVAEEDITSTESHVRVDRNGGKPGFVSFYGLRRAREDALQPLTLRNNQSSLLWFAGPAVLVASFILPSLYLRKIISTIFEDSLLTDFLILFFTEALFYCGVAAFLFLIDYLWRPSQTYPATSGDGKLTAQMGHRISSVAILMLSLIIPMVTMGFVWPWTGPAASAALAPYLVGIVVQFAFEQYARYVKSPSWPVIPVVFQVYRLHQLNRAAQLVTALSFTIRAAEMTAHNLAINNSLSTLLNVLQLLGLICIWSLSSFLMRFFPSPAVNEQ